MDDDRPGLDPALFDRLWDELHKPTYYMGMRVFPFDAQTARRERYIPLKLLFFWLEKLPHPGGFPPDLELFALAQRHIRIGHLKTHGPSWRYFPEIFELEPESVEVIEGGQVLGEVRVSELIATEKVESDNPLIDIHDFAAWFREVSPEYLKLPAGFPGADTGAMESGEPDHCPLEEPEWLIFSELADAFAGLYIWEKAGWLQTLRSSEAAWIDNEECIRRGGKKGPAKLSKAHPVNVGMSLLARLKMKNSEMVTEVARELDKRFDEQPSLKPWRALWHRARRAQNTNLPLQ